MPYNYLVSADQQENVANEAIQLLLVLLIFEPYVLCVLLLCSPKALSLAPLIFSLKLCGK